MVSGRVAPLSPLIFAVVVDVLLRRIEATVEGRGLVRAFADDTAATIEDVFGLLPRVAGLFDEYAAISWASLKLWQDHHHTSLDAFRAWL